MADGGSDGFPGARRGLHRVRRLTLALSGPDEAALLAARARLAAEAERFETAFAPVFDAHAGPDEVIRLERLEIDLGPDARLDAASLAAALGRALARSLPPRESVDAAPSRASAAPHGGPTARLIEALAYFLRLGTLPWWAPAARIADIDAALAALTDAEIATVARRLQPVLRSVQAATRFLLQIEPAGARRIAAALPGANGVAVPASGWPAFADWRAAACAPATDAANGGPREALVALIRRAAGSPAAPLPRAPSAEARDTRREPAPSRPEADDAEEWPESKEDAGPLPIPHAGVVLAGPFLPALFDRLDLLDGRAFHSTAAAERAAAFIGALAGGPPPDEPAMALAKLITGQPLDAPQPRGAALTEAEQEAVGALLSAMVGHWTALGNATPEGLRETFLRRGGHLTPGANADRLEVERRGVDVLLDRLPWTFSPLRLPWMARPLVVDWR